MPNSNERGCGDPDCDSCDENAWWRLRWCSSIDEFIRVGYTKDYEVVSHEDIPKIIAEAVRRRDEEVREMIERMRDADEEPCNVFHPYYSQYLDDWKERQEVFDAILSRLTHQEPKS